MKNRMAVIALLGLCLTGAADPKLVLFESTEGRFRIGLPGKPEFRTTQAKGEEGQLDLRIFGVAQRDGGCGIMYFDETAERIRTATRSGC